MVLQLERNAGERPAAVGNEHKDGKDRKGVRLDCGLTILLTVHTKQKTDNVFHLFIFYFLLVRQILTFYVKLQKNSHTYIDLQLTLLSTSFQFHP